MIPSHAFTNKNEMRNVSESTSLDLRTTFKVSANKNLPFANVIAYTL